MNKVFIGVGILVLVGGGLVVTRRQSQPATQVVMEKKVEPEAMADKSESRYVEYNKERLDGAVNKRRVLYFYASWCPTCRPADANLKENMNKIPEDVAVIRVNYNDPETDEEEKGLAKKYGITYQHTFVQIDAQGQEVTKWNGGQTEELAAKIK